MITNDSELSHRQQLLFLHSQHIIREHHQWKIFPCFCSNRSWMMMMRANTRNQFQNSIFKVKVQCPTPNYNIISAVSQSVVASGRDGEQSNHGNGIYIETDKLLKR